MYNPAVASIFEKEKSIISNSITKSAEKKWKKKFTILNIRKKNVINQTDSIFHANTKGQKWCEIERVENQRKLRWMKNFPVFLHTYVMWVYTCLVASRVYMVTESLVNKRFKLRFIRNFIKQRKSGK